MRTIDIKDRAAQPAPPQKRLSVRFHLKNRTQDIHNALHAWPPARALESGHAQDRDYRDYLLGLYGARVRLDKVLDTPGLCAAAQTHSLIAADLIELETPEALLSSCVSAVPELVLTTQAKRLGAAYVALGSHFGNAQFAAQLAKQPHTARWPKRFISDQGGHQHAAWLALLPLLDEVGAHASGLDGMVYGAEYTFEWLHSVLMGPTIRYRVPEYPI